MTAEISEKTKFTLPVVAAMITCVITGTSGVMILSNQIATQDRRLARIERRLGIENEDVAAAGSSSELYASERRDSRTR